MAMNYEFERHILAAKVEGNKKAVQALEAQRTVFNSFVEAGIVKELPKEPMQDSASEQTLTGEVIYEAEKFSRYVTVEIDGTVIKNRRNDLGLTQMQLASQIGNISRGYISIIERRESTIISKGKAELIASVLEIPSQDFIKTTIGSVVKAWRSERNITLRRLVEITGLSLGYLSQLENGRILRPGSDIIQQLAQALNIPIEVIESRYSPTQLSSQSSLSNENPS